MRSRAVFASKMSFLRGELSFREFSRVIRERTGRYISHSTLYQYCLPDGKSPSPGNLDVLSAFAEKPVSWFFDKNVAQRGGTEGVIVHHLVGELQAIRERLMELERLRTEAGLLRSLDIDQKTRMLDFLNARMGPMVQNERNTVESFLDCWPDIAEILGPEAKKASHLLTEIVREFFPSLSPRLESISDS